MATKTQHIKRVSSKKNSRTGNGKIDIYILKSVYTTSVLLKEYLCSICNPSSIIGPIRVLLDIIPRKNNNRGNSKHKKQYISFICILSLDIYEILNKVLRNPVSENKVLRSGTTDQSGIRVEKSISICTILSIRPYILNRRYDFAPRGKRFLCIQTPTKYKLQCGHILLNRINVFRSCGMLNYNVEVTNNSYIYMISFDKRERIKDIAITRLILNKSVWNSKWKHKHKINVIWHSKPDVKLEVNLSEGANLSEEVNISEGANLSEEIQCVDDLKEYIPLKKTYVFDFVNHVSLLPW